jgi:uncharacterized phage-like protein YoqJ
MMSNKNFTASVSGNRTLLKDFNINKLKETFNKLIKIANINTFLVGMAVGFDTVCFNVLEEIRKTEDIKIVACIPCENQDYNFSLAQKKEYNRMLLSSDEKIYIAKEYTKACMLKRNRYLVDNSSVLVVYSRKDTGGTVYTKNYALKKGVPIIEL